MESISESKQLSISIAKVIRANGDIEYHYSLPKLSIFNIKGMLWLWRRLKEYKKERLLSKDKITKVIYN